MRRRRSDNTACHSHAQKGLSGEGEEPAAAPMELESTEVLIEAQKKKYAFSAGDVWTVGCAPPPPPPVFLLHDPTIAARSRGAAAATT